MKKEAYEVEYYEPKSVLAMQADRKVFPRPVAPMKNRDGAPGQKVLA